MSGREWQRLLMTPETKNRRQTWLLPRVGEVKLEEFPRLWNISRHSVDVVQYQAGQSGGFMVVVAISFLLAIRRGGKRACDGGLAQYKCDDSNSVRAHLFVARRRGRSRAIATEMYIRILLEKHSNHQLVATCALCKRSFQA